MNISTLSLKHWKKTVRKRETKFSIYHNPVVRKYVLHLVTKVEVSKAIDSLA